MINLPSKNIVNEFTPFGVIIGSQSIDESFIITADTVISPWLSNNRHPLRCSDLAQLLTLDVDFVLVGTGVKQVIPDPSVYRAFVDKGMSIEFMDSAAACRTYNILAGEQRQVGAGIKLPIR